MNQNQTTGQKSRKRISRLNFLSRREIAELPRLLMPGEQVLGIISGFYSTGPATLCVTSKRLLLIDKKLLRLNYEDIRFESIKEVSYSHEAFMASVKFFYAGRTLQFKSWYRHELRALAQFAQHRMFEVHEEAEPTADDLHLTEAADEKLATPIQYQANPQLEKYLTERIARWRRATRFIDNLPKPVESHQTLEQQY